MSQRADYLSWMKSIAKLNGGWGVKQGGWVGGWGVGGGGVVGTKVIISLRRHLVEQFLLSFPLDLLFPFGIVMSFEF